MKVIAKGKSEGRRRSSSYKEVKENRRGGRRGHVIMCQACAK